MQLDADDLKLLHDIGNLRAAIRNPQVFLETLSPHGQWLKMKEMETELRTMEARFVRVGLVAAGLAEPIDEEALALASKADHSSRLAPADPVLLAECRAPKTVALQVPRPPLFQRLPSAAPTTEVHK